MTKSPDAFRTISEVADWLGVPAHVLRFWESKFTQVKPVKRAGGRRYYRPADMQLLGGIKALLHNDGMTIKGVQKMLREQGIGKVSSMSPPLETDLESSIEIEAEDIEVTSEAPESKVLPFKARQAGAAAPELPFDTEPAEAEAEEPDAPAVAAAPEPEPEAPAEEPAPVAARTPEGPRLPSFLHRAKPEADAAEPARPRARAVDAPDPPPDSEIEAAPGILSRLTGLDRLDAAQARDLAPVAQALRAWLAQAGGARAL
ncbi:MerR family transcriptional regulator [Seohaeicola nanhaiensis]|uniref:MerR family transcriptional regulator n=1 Tax=Seohaeicola nanhaiensis TaxID=1387282 RepID=A0ABV9KLC3_9RHOB